MYNVYTGIYEYVADATIPDLVHSAVTSHAYSLLRIYKMASVLLNYNLLYKLKFYYVIIIINYNFNLKLFSYRNKLRLKIIK